jgi:DMSO/TMAO reductase YedYZ molybdopterin-dependent catalytic subunit
MTAAASRARLDPQGFHRRIPLAPHQLQARITRSEDVIVLCHLGVPRLDRDAWSLSVDGLVTPPLTLRYDDLTRYPKAEIASVHQCAGSPLQSLEPTRRICNVTWGGARLADILADCGVRENASHVWSSGADHGEFGGIAVDAYLKDLPIDRVRSDVLIAYEMNGAALSPEHGFPARLVVPGFYGTNSVKWLTRITLADRRAAGPFTTRWYNDPVLGDAGEDTSKTTPVWAIAPESVIVSPAPGESVAAGVEREAWGWAWADGGVRSVALSSNGGADWADAQIEPPRGRQWQQFSRRWVPDRRGSVMLASRATAMDGASQPPSGWRNAVHGVTINVT